MNGNVGVYILQKEPPTLGLFQCPPQSTTLRSNNLGCNQTCAASD